MTDDLSEWYETARQIREAKKELPSLEHLADIQWKQMQEYKTTARHSKKRKRKKYTGQLELI
jgi:hypothetical protein